MENDLLEKVVEGKVYSVKTIVISSLVASVFASSFMLYKNFKTFKDYRKANFTIVISILTFLIMVASVIIPALDKIPSLYYSLIFSMGTSVIVNRYQSKLINFHVNNGGATYETAKAVAVCIIALLLAAGLLYIIIYFQDSNQYLVE
jgi:hypothetical protein